MMSCQTCGAPLPEGARFCPACGVVVTRADETGSRRPVTIVFTDIVGSTALGERLDPETLGGVLARYYETMRAVVERHGGAVEKFIGDAVVATFGAPEVHEDDGLRAVRAAHEMHWALGDLNDELERRWDTRLEVRTGIATGDVLAGGGPAVLGSPANLAARLQAEAGDGEILLSADTERLTRGAIHASPVGALTLKGFDEPIESFRLVDLDGDARPKARTPHIGREQELALLELAYRRAVRDRRAQLVTVLGEPGIGKTRLVEEAVGRLGDDPLVVRGRCLPYGEGITFFPVSEAVASAVGIEREDDAARAKAKIASVVPADASRVADRVSEAIGLGGRPGAPEETLWAIRRFFELLAATRPLVMIFDDLHWAEPTFLDLVAQLVERGRGAAELVVAVARPELHEQRADWAGGTANAVTISLEPLTTDEGVSLVRSLATGASIDDTAAARLAATAGGNPLFIEEYVAMLVDDGILVERDGRWQVPADLTVAASTPPTLLGLLTARLHRLPRNERDTLVHASVIGKVFAADELAVVVEPGIDVEGAVRRLLERDLLVAAAGDVRTMEFQHQLLRDAAYASLPKSRRAVLHERFADHLEVASGDRPEELDELAGYHLAEAHDYRAGLGTDDDISRSLGDRAAHRLGAAGERAVERGDASAGIRLLHRAVEQATQPMIRVQLRLPLCQAMSDAADTAGLEAAVSVAIAEAVDVGDERLRLRFEHLRIASALLYDPQATLPEQLIETLRDLAAQLHALGDDEGVAECHYQLASVAWFVGDTVGFEASARRALEHAIASGNIRSVGRAADYVISAAIRGPTPLAAVLEELQGIRDTVTVGLAASAELRVEEAEILAYLDRTDEARALVNEASAELAELGLARSAAAAGSVRGIVEDQAGDLEASEAVTRRSYEFFLDNGDVGNGGLLAVQLADVLARMGRSQEADRLALATAETSPQFDIEAQVGWRMASARAKASLGDVDDGIRLAEDGLRRLDGTDLDMLRADLLRTYGDVLNDTGRVDDAADRWRRALDAYRAKGHAAGVRRVATSLAGVGVDQSS